MKTKRRAQGFSLLEVLISIGILGLVMATIYQSLYSGSKEYEVNSRRAWTLHQARLAVDELSEELRQATRLSVTPVQSVANAPAETAAVNNVSFKKVLPSINGVKQETTNYITYKWIASQESVSSAPVTVTSPLTGSTYTLGGAVWIDANGNGVHDDGMLVRIDDNGTRDHARIMCNYLKNDPNGFKITQSVVTVSGEKMLQIHITLTLNFVDSLNKTQEQTVESKVFVRNLQ